MNVCFRENAKVFATRPPTPYRLNIVFRIGILENIYRFEHT
jgi:hypothetical protein